MTIERSVRLIAGVFILLTVAGGYWLSGWFYLLTAVMGANLAQSAFTNWCPAMTVLRGLGVQDSQGDSP